ncbi:MAG: DUF1289 domain-containing protein [Gammaproteobacteria bacterium]|nr:DUF1289 domain-containing protein [Gammaproteobacteria bacterium]
MNGPAITTLESPCIGVCALDGLFCLGCGRSVDEIERWSQASTAERVAILQRIKADLTN